MKRAVGGTLVVLVVLVVAWLAGWAYVELTLYGPHRRDAMMPRPPDLPDAGYVAGKVVRPDGQDVFHVLITAAGLDAGQLAGRAFADYQGAFSLPGLGDGRFVVRAETASWKEGPQLRASAEVEVRDGRAPFVVLTLGLPDGGVAR